MERVKVKLQLHPLSTFVFLLSHVPTSDTTCPLCFSSCCLLLPASTRLLLPAPACFYLLLQFLLPASSAPTKCARNRNNLPCVLFFWRFLSCVCVARRKTEGGRAGAAAGGLPPPGCGMLKCAKSLNEFQCCIEYSGVASEPSG